MPFLYLLVIFWCACYAAPQIQLNFRRNPEIFYTTTELICSAGYHVQEHNVVTNDGFILSVHRIPGGKRRPKTPKKKHHYYHLHTGYHPDFASCVNESLNESTNGHPVLLIHGLTATSDCWVLQGPNYDLAFLLADRGYDVWLPNIRGNFYSRNHKTLKPEDSEFWDFSFHENGYYDIPNTIDYILKLRGVSKVTFIGHSMGTTIFFVMASSRPEYQEKISLFVGFTPVSRLKRENFSTNMLGILNLTLLYTKGHIDNGYNEFLPRNVYTILLAQILCSKGSSFQDICYDVCFSFSGYHSKLFSRKRLPVFMSHGFGGTSVKTFLHYRQLLDTEYFQWYDQGPEENLRLYGDTKPPIYDLTKIKTPVALFYSTGDTIANVKDVRRLKSFLPNLIESREYTTLNHIDFIWAFNARDIIFDRVFELMDKYRNQ